MSWPEGIFYIRQVPEDVTVRSIPCNVPHLYEHQPLNLEPRLLEIVAGVSTRLNLGWNNLVEIQFAVGQ